MGIEDVLQIVLSAIGVLGLYILNDLTKSVRSATQEISELNVKIGMIIQRGENHEREISLIKRTIELIRERLHNLGTIINGMQLTHDITWAKKGD
tara:strand:- start:238 stop:522 length:285 start_codon:yes stop_codon:yes gene_type:complete